MIRDAQDGGASSLFEAGGTGWCESAAASRSLSLVDFAFYPVGKTPRPNPQEHHSEKRSSDGTERDLSGGTGPFDFAQGRLSGTRASRD